VVSVTESSGTLRRSYKFLLRPTGQQTGALIRMLADHCELYNAALQERRDAWKQGVRVGLYDQFRQLKDIRQVRPEFAGWAFASERETVRRVDRAFMAFYRRVKAGETPGYPRFKSRHRFDSVTWPDSEHGVRWIPADRRIYLMGIGHVRVHAHREVEGRIKTVTVKREGKRWYVTLSCDQVPARPLPEVGRHVGIDLGIAHFATTSDGEHIANPRHFTAGAKRLVKAQRNLATKRRGSSRRRKARARVTSAHRKIRELRRDFHHKTALALVRRHDVLVVEDLASGRMSRSSRGTVSQPGTNVAQKAGLNRSILDAGWGSFLRILSDKAACAGRELIAVAPHYTSQRCSACGHIAKENRVTQAAFRCVACDFTAHADHNAAVNILRAGLARRGQPREAA
jgi:putative transposase